MRRTLSSAGAFLIVIAAALAAQTPPVPQQPTNETAPRPATGGLLGRPSPPQPVQKQAIEYFIGTWTFTWTGRESGITPGPRTGTVTYTRLGDSPFLEFVTEGKSEGTGAFKESGTLGWNAAQKVMAMHERLIGNVEMLSVGDWSSPIAIRFESSPVSLKTQTLRLRRAYGIVSATSFTVSEEISVDSGPFVRLGGGVFMKRQN
jgi:hypothetical protein